MNNRFNTQHKIRVGGCYLSNQLFGTYSIYNQNITKDHEVGGSDTRVASRDITPTSFILTKSTGGLK